MPKPTFFNLSYERREAVLTAARQEFASYDPVQASISRTVATAGIAKGSFYQYFADKDDLYLYLLDLCCRQRLAFMATLQPPDGSFFDRVRWLMAGAAKFHLSYPEEEQIMRRAVQSDHPLRAEAQRMMGATVSTVWDSLIAQGREQGELNPTFHPELVQFVFTTLTVGLGQHVGQQLEPGDDSEAYTERFFSVFAELVRMLEFGLRPRS